MAGFDFGAPRIRPLGRQFARTKVDPRLNNGTTGGGLAHVLQSAMAGYERRKDNERVEKDEQDYSDAQRALVSGLKGEPALDAPLPEGISGPVRPELPGGFDAAAAELATLEGNPYAGRMATQLLMNQRAQEAEAQQAEDIYQRNRADSLSDWERNRQADREDFQWRQQNTYRAPTPARIERGADGYLYNMATGRRALPGVERTPEYRPMTADDVAAYGLPEGTSAQMGADGRVQVLNAPKPPKPLPSSALKIVVEAQDKLATLDGLNTDLQRFEGMLEDGSLNLSPLTNMQYGLRNAAGLSTPESANFQSFKSTLEKMRNDSLRLNNGVQTEGDAQRAWNELMASITDERVVKQRLKEIREINKRGANLQNLQIDTVYNNFGSDRPEAPVEPSDAGGWSAQEVGPQ